MKKERRLAICISHKIQVEKNVILNPHLEKQLGLPRKRNVSTQQCGGVE